MVEFYFWAENFGRVVPSLAKELISIKGTREGLVIFFDPDKEFEEIKKNLKQKIEAARGFFRGAKFILDQANQSLDVQQRVELEMVCQQYGLVPSPNIRWPVSLARNSSGERTRLIHAHLRSGQQIDYRGNLVLVGDVHPGACIFSNGDIIIMGKCQGEIYAGNPDHSKAVVVALDLSPNRLTIAGVEFKRAKKNFPSRTPQMALLENGKPTFRPYLKYSSV